MKYIFTLMLGVSGLMVAAQSADFTLTFEDSAVIAQHYYTDSLLDSLRIWQIGAPHKSNFSSSFSPFKAVVTLTDSLIPASTEASFIIMLPDVYLNSYTGGFLSFRHKYDMDSAHGEAYVDFSVDSGQHWHSVRPASERHDCEFYTTILDGLQFYPPTWWDNLSRRPDADSNYYLYGKTGIWQTDTIGFAPSWYAVKTDQLTNFMLRFTIKTDSDAIPSEGWLIDNIQYAGYSIFCGGGINDLNSSRMRISPNPATGAFQIALTDQPARDYTVTMTDLMGRKMLEKSFYGTEVLLYRDGLSDGSYLVRVTNDKTGDSFSKRIVLE